jgi:VanZ family protein
MQWAVLFNSSVCRVLLLIAVAIALTMALLPHPPHLPIDSLGDKFEHSLAFVVITVLAVAGYPETPLTRIGERLSFLGALIEVFQSIPFIHRDCDVLDWITDTVAIIVVLLIVRLVRRGPAARGLRPLR